MIRMLTAVLIALLMAVSACAQKASAPAVTTTDSAEVQEFQHVEDAWSAALNSRDQYGLELVLSPLFVDISASGDVTTRNQQIVQLLNSEDKSLRYEQKVITVRKLGDVAVANGAYELNRKGLSGPITENGVFTHVFERTHNAWLCINSQRTLLHETLASKAAKSGKSEKRPSSSESGFHLPMLSK